MHIGPLGGVPLRPGAPGTLELHEPAGRLPQRMAAQTHVPKKGRIEVAVEQEATFLDVLLHRT